jgi:hypothetical protein
LEEAVNQLATKQEKPNLAAIFEKIDQLTTLYPRIPILHYSITYIRKVIKRHASFFWGVSRKMQEATVMAIEVDQTINHTLIWIGTSSHSKTPLPPSQPRR